MDYSFNLEFSVGSVQAADEIMVKNDIEKGQAQTISS